MDASTNSSQNYVSFKIVTLFIGFLFYSGSVYSQSLDEISAAAIEITTQKVVYDPSYFAIDYPNGDVPEDRGVCTDVIIRTYRKLNIDLQKDVHEDMKFDFNSYPNLWSLNTTDKNIDHRRVPNLMTFFERRGESKEITDNPADYLPGSVVCWRLKGGQTHIGIVIDQNSSDGKRPLIVHNIGGGQVIEDCLFSFEIIGHYTYRPFVLTVVE